MTVTPFTPLLPPVSPTGGAVTTDALGTPGGEGFAALVAGLLGGAPGVPGAAPAVPGVVTTGEGETETGDQEGEPTGVAAEDSSAVVDEAATAVAGAVAPMLGLHSLGHLAALVPVTPTVVKPADDEATSTDVTLEADAVATTGKATPATPGLGTAEEKARPELPATAADRAVAVTADRPAGEPAPAPVQQGPSSQAQPSQQAVQVAPVHAAAPASSTNAPSVGASPVVQQVLPEVARMASSGNGTHRLTMTLKPEALGEVRITLTVRDGEVRVRLAGGEEAQRALAEGAPELRRVLEMAGAHDTKVVVRDLVTGLQQSSQSSSTQTQSSLAGHGHQGRTDHAATGQDRSGSQNQHAGTRGGTTARDGVSDGAATPRHEPARRSPSVGVDLTM